MCQCANLKRLYQEELTRKIKMAAYCLPLNVYENVGGKVKTFFILLTFLQLILINKRRHKGNEA